MNQEHRKLVEQLSSTDESERLAAQEAVLAMGEEAIPYLNWVRSRPYYALEALRMLAIIGDGCTGKVKEDLIYGMRAKARTSPLTPPEQSAIAQEALRRWGIENPDEWEPTPRCYICKRPVTEELQVKRCVICDQYVCEEHKLKVDPKRNTWLCPSQHKTPSVHDDPLLRM